MLDNPSFVAKAPQDKVEKEKAKLKAYEDELQVYLDKKANL